MNGMLTTTAPTRVPTRFRRTFELTLPQRLRRSVAPGTFFRADLVNDEMVLRPVQVIDRDQAWFWTSEWQEKERQANEDIRAGRVSGPFRSVKAFMRGLKRAR